MAGEIAIHLATGLANIKAEIIFPDANYGWTGTQAVLRSAVAPADLQAGLVSLTESEYNTGDKAGLYVGDFPAGITTPGTFGVRVWQTETWPPSGDPLGVMTIDWNGSREAAFPPNLENLGINASGHVSRVTLVDTCTQNSDMRGTDGAATPADLGDLQTHGDSNWATADTSNLATATALDALQSHGDSAWTTATGFATSAALAAVGDKVEAILEDTSITGVVMAGYTAPDNEGIAAIKAQTDKLAFVGGDVKATLDGEKVAATLAAGDVTGNLPAMVNAYAPSLEPVAIDTAAIAEAVDQQLTTAHGSGSWVASEIELSGVATSEQLQALQSHGDSAWATAVGFASPSDIQSLQSHGDAVWKTATGFTVPSDLVPLATSEQLQALQSHGDSFWVTATGFAVPGSAMTLTSGERNAVADAVLSRDVANAESSAAEHSLCTIVLASLESSINGTTWTIKRTDGVTTHATKTLTTDETADPITGVS